MSSPTRPALPLTTSDLDPDPVRQFAAWLEHARHAGVHEPEAMALATASADAAPSARMVLLRGFGPAGFDLYTNYESRKAGELDANPRAALVFHWDSVGRQIRIEGSVSRIGGAESDAYFAGRPRGSQIGAWASAQSTPLGSRAELEDRVAQLTERFDGRPVPRPPGWGGYRLRPAAYEFWQHGGDRLHDRFHYQPDGPGWRITRLSP